MAVAEGTCRLIEFNNLYDFTPLSYNYKGYLSTSPDGS
jgi:hypothetical protein